MAFYNQILQNKQTSKQKKYIPFLSDASDSWSLRKWTRFSSILFVLVNKNELPF